MGWGQGGVGWGGAGWWWVELDGSCGSARLEPFWEARRSKLRQMSDPLQKKSVIRKVSMRPS